ncbi:hypothetical protein N6H05_20180 [Sphingobium sp. WTD-1]|uniref:hypothetical protein n=1 Tax=Sphingobium sp. WTD-1 TaxID=2979467 RepID=UPI0024DE67FD|nr:hypothetical protein [Sphingobium sp. WTD-1]WIA55327.1 hypothetical protein N6H05_20180 [Sphingobium sp. WTD-1]
MQLLTKDRENLMTVERIERAGSELVIHGEIMGALPVRAVLTPGEARKAFRLLDLRTMFFIGTLLFRRDRGA